MAETESDQFPNGGWLDGSGAENGDKCAWISSGQGASAKVTFPNGSSFPVQPLWSNAFNNNAGAAYCRIRRQSRRAPATTVGARALPLDLRRAA